MQQHVRCVPLHGLTAERSHSEQSLTSRSTARHEWIRPHSATGGTCILVYVCYHMCWIYKLNWGQTSLSEGGTVALEEIGRLSTKNDLDASERHHSRFLYQSCAGT